VFGADAASAESQTREDIALEEEKLYQEYLAARAKQADSTADNAGRLAAALPADQARLKEAEDAKAAADDAQAELEVHTTRLVKSTAERKHAKVEPPRSTGRYPNSQCGICAAGTKGTCAYTVCSNYGPRRYHPNAGAEANRGNEAILVDIGG